MIWIKIIFMIFCLKKNYKSNIKMGTQFVSCFYIYQKAFLLELPLNMYNNSMCENLQGLIPLYCSENFLTTM